MVVEADAAPAEIAAASVLLKTIEFDLCSTEFVRPMLSPFFPKSNMELSLASCGGAGMFFTCFSGDTGAADPPLP